MQDQLASCTVTTAVRKNVVTEVARGYRNSDGTPVVIKRLRAEHPHPLALARLRHEFAILQSLDPPCVVRALELQPVGHGLALVLEDAGDVSVGSLIQAGHLDFRRCLELAIAMAKAVRTVHALGIVHKDLKPEHFVVRREDPSAIVLVDFATATRLSRHTPSVAQVSQLEGTLAYIAPEQTGRMNRVVDRRSDLYSLGVSLYQLFTGRLPFPASDPLELIHSHIARAPRPPHEADPGVPRIVSQIILKLMEKAAEDRYQSAEGVQADLERCLLHLDPDGRIPEFPLGDRDASDQLAIPQRLYGRQQELQSVLDCFGRVKGGATELLLLRGGSGVGKSALVAELHQPMVHGGYFAAGKFDQLARGVPYAPIVHACRRLIQSILAEPPDALARHKRALLEALGPNGRLVTDLVPTLERIIGSQPDTPVLGPTESQRRFDRTLQSFLGTFASPDHPLVLFFDDLQWVDPASLRLIEVLLRSSRGHLLVIGAYRESEVDAVHPLTLALERLRNAGVVTRHVVLAPLDLSNLSEFLEETLRSTHERVGPLADILFSKTQGNPFFLHQLLGNLYEQGLLRFDAQSHAWEWDIGLVRTSLVTENVVEFMLARLRQLPPAAQQVLSMAACIGNEFDDRTLTIVCGQRCASVRWALQEVLKQALVVPIDSQSPALADFDPASDPAEELTAHYRFQHDRVQEAAYALVDDADKAQVHLRIGRLLLARTGKEPTGDDLFTVIDHLNMGIDAIGDSEEARHLARLNVLAGKRSRAAGAPASGVHHTEVALRLLGPRAWTTDYELAYSAHLTKAECEYLTGKQDEALRLLEAAESHSQTTLERVAARNLRVVLLTNAGRAREACAEAVSSLRMLDVEVPEPDDKAALGSSIQADFAAYQIALAGREIESLAELPPTSDPMILALMDTFVNAIPPAYQCNPELHVALVLKAVAQPLYHGTAPVSPFFYVQYALAHMVITGDLSAAYRFGKLGLDLCERVGTPALAGPVHFVFGCFISHWRQPFSVAQEHFRIGFRLSLELGDYIHAGFCASIASSYQFFASGSLDEVEAKIPDALQFARRTDDLVDQQVCELFLAAVRALQGQTRCLSSLDRQGFDEVPFCDALLPPVLPWYRLIKTLLCYLSGDYAEALAAADAFHSGPGMLATPEHAFYRALSLAELARAAEPHQRQPLLERLRADADLLKIWADSAPSNYAPRYNLVRAELAALQGDALEAMRRYDEAIAEAQQSAFLQLEAICCEACARFHLADDRERVGRAYLKDAVYAYERWGAIAKASQIKNKHPNLVETTFQSAEALMLGSTDSTTSRQDSAQLDLTTAIRATEALATELSFDRLLERLMHSAIENAGAQRGFLVLAREGSLRLEAAITIDPDTVRLHLGEDVQASQQLAGAVVQYVARTGEPLALGDAVRDPRFLADPYIFRYRPKSILAVPMLYRGKLSGVLYVENGTTTDAFNPAREGLLQFIASQAAAAIENAILYGDLETASAQLRRANETLESQVMARTEELRKALARVWSEMDLARKIQTVLLPAETKLPHYEIAATMIPADDVGGDYYDVIPSGTAEGWVLIGDVSGHGVTAGLVMMMVQSAVRTALKTLGGQGPISPAAVLSYVNSSLWNNLQQISSGQPTGGQYMTITALRVQGSRVHYAGLHQDILVYRAGTRCIEQVETSGAWIGVLEDLSTVLEDRSVDLESGDILLLYTDGLTELPTEDGGLLGTKGLCALLEGVVARTTEPAAIVKSILAPLASKTVHDDVTLMAIRHIPAPVAT